ncbi:MAG: Gfo/Idh/MocA family protein [Candidatus Poribacteria bacterium]
MVKIGIVGIGFMGMMHYYASKKLAGAEVIAICTRSQKKLDGDWRDIQGNYGPRGGIEDLSNLRKYNNLDDILADKDIDMLDICLPTHLHSEASIGGLNAGKHVMVEKPIALDLDSANEMVAAAEKSGRYLMVGHVLPFFAEFAYAKNIVESGKYGKLMGGHFKRIITDPTWSEDIADYSKTGGPGIDLHIHDTHFIQLISGMPDSVYSRGMLVEDKYVRYLSTQYIYEDKEVCLTAASGAISQPGRAFAHGYEIYLEKATILFESATLGNEGVTSMPVTLLTSDGEIHQPDMGAGDPVDSFTAEIQYAVDSIRNDETPVALSGQGARDALLLCYKEAESVKKGAAVKCKG